MPRSGGRLNLAGALNRNMPPGHLNPLVTEPYSKQASVCRLEKELKAVKEENNRLRHQLDETRSALKEITTEASLDNFDERRINLLKMQIIQLQKQVLLMSEALGSRSTALMEVENALTWLSGKFRHYIGLEVRGAEVPVYRSDLITMVDTTESARIKLFKNVENCSKENLAHPQMLMNSFLKPGQDKEFTTLDCCLGRLDCLNLRHVAQLESKLSRLYKELITVSEYLNSRVGMEEKLSVGHMSGAVQEREGTVILRACAMSRDCAADLLSLSLLFPSAPWPPLKKPAVAEVTYEALAPSLPALSRGKAAEVQRCVTAALKACNHRCYMVGQEAGALREEVRFHQAIYQLQLDYVQQAFDALRKGYSEFEHSTNDLLIQPLKKLLEAYRRLRTNTSHEGLKDFLTILKQQELQWEDIIQKLDISDPQNQSGSAALSAFGEEFLASLNQLLLARQTQRDKAAAHKDDLKATQQQLEEGLRTLIARREEQHKAVKELDNKDLTQAVDGPGGGGDLVVESEMSLLSHRSSSRLPYPAEEGEEAPSGLRPWLDEPHISAHNDGGKKKGKKSQGGAVTHQKPWQDVGDVMYPDGMDAIFRPGSGRSQCRSRSEEKGTAREMNTGLRPWLDDQGYAEEQNYTSRSERKTPVLENSDMPMEVSSRSSVYDCNTNSSHGLYPQDGADSSRSERLPHLASDTLPDSSALPQNPCPNQAEEGNVSKKPFPSKPPASTNSSSRRPSLAGEKEKSKWPAKPRNYEPKLYVANRTLSLRRSGSLSRLSEPSLQEQMSKMSIASRQALEHSRTNGEKNSK